MSEVTTQKRSPERNKEIVLRLFTQAAINGELHPTREELGEELGEKLGLHPGGIYAYIAALVREGKLERHGSVNRYYYTVTASNLTTRKPTFLKDELPKKPPTTTLPMPDCISKVDAHLEKFEREDAEKLDSDESWWATKRKNRKLIYKKNVGAKRDFSWDVNTTEIIRTVAKECGLRPDELSSTCRTETLAQARWLVMYLLRTGLGLSYAQIGYRLHRNHATAMHGVRKVKARIEADKAYASQVEALHDKIKRRVAA